jgi:hypothetical protein
LFQAEVHDCPLALAGERKRWAVPQEHPAAQAPRQQAARRQVAHPHPDPAGPDQAVYQAEESQAVRKEQRGGRVSWQAPKLVRWAQGPSLREQRLQARVRRQASTLEQAHLLPVRRLVQRPL